MAAFQSWRGVHSIKLQQEHQYFTVAAEDGFQIFCIDPLVKVEHVREKRIGSVRNATMYYRQNFIAFISGGSKPMFDERRVTLWDYLTDKCPMRVLTKEPVVDMIMATERLIMILRSRVLLIQFKDGIKDGETLAEIETWDNPNGVCAVSHGGRKMAFPAKRSRGCIQIEDLDKDDSSPNSKPPIILQAHSNDIVCTAMDHPGNLLATASSQGTNIHLYHCDAKDVSLRTKLRRGVDKANIYCLNFSKDSNYLCCSSDKGTVHIWNLKDLDMNPVSTIKPLVGLPQEMKSYASFAVRSESACVVTFGAGDQDTIYAICLDGSFYKYKLGRDGSQTNTGKNCYMQSYDIFPNVGAFHDC